jgi:hypothetical protein
MHRKTVFLARRGHFQFLSAGSCSFAIKSRTMVQIGAVHIALRNVGIRVVDIHPSAPATVGSIRSRRNAYPRGSDVTFIHHSSCSQ